MAESAAQRIYDALPGGAQTLALNAYGLRNRRRQQRWESILTELAPSERWSPGEQRGRTAARLREILEHAVLYAPRYQGLARLLPGIRAADEDIFALLGEFPALTRAEVLADQPAFLSRAFDRGRLRRTITSGTTGTPFTSWLEPGALLTSDALWWRRTLWAGYAAGDWVARLVGDPVIPLSVKNPDPPWRISWSDRRLYFSTYHLDRGSARRIADCLARRKPAFMMGYPSALDALARMTEGVVDTSGWRPKAILFSSEPLYDHQREAIGRFVQAPIRGLYGCAERIVSAAQCDRDSYHLSLVDGYVEGQFDGAAASGPARITGLLNRAMPLIRFELGDALALRAGHVCPCGRTLPAIEPVVTKLEDVVRTPSGRVISPSILTWAFKELPGVERSQIVQQDAQSVDVLLQVDERSFPEARSILLPRLQEMFFGEMQVAVHRRAALELTSAGKSRFVVNKCSGAGAGRDAGA